MSIPTNVLLGSGLGALGGLVTAPKDEKMKSTLMGAGWGGVAGGIGPGLISKLKGKSFSEGLKSTSLKEAAKGAGIVTGTTAVVNKMTGAYDQNSKNKHNAIRTFAPAADDLAILGATLLKSSKVK
jgi:hypothetical protein